VGGLKIYDENSTLSRATAIELYTRGSAWFSNEQQKKGDIAVGMLADLAVLNLDYFEVEDEQIKAIEADLTIVDGQIVYAKGDFSSFSPPSIPVLPDWSPTNKYNGYYSSSRIQMDQSGNVCGTDGKDAVLATVHSCKGSCNVHAHNHDVVRSSNLPINNYTTFWGALGCSCFAF
jgi:hypothetical protein